MRTLALSLLITSAVAALGQSPMPMGAPMRAPMSAGPLPGERLGTVSFPVSCSPQVQAQFNRGVALLHDFWYAEAPLEFQRIAKEDPSCAMAHWGLVMSSFQQIWDRPGKESMTFGWEEIQKAQSLGAKTQRERDYIAALAAFYRPGDSDYAARINAYSAAMGALYRKYPDDVDAGAFYALSLLASVAPNDTSLQHAHEAMSVLAPLLAKYPDNPGVVHYIIHACDNPAMAKDGLAAADHYGEIAPSGPHATHMPGHIFARLGMWQQDIDSQLASIRAAEAADAHHESGIMDEPHSYDFLMYAYLQSGQDASAKQVLATSATVIDRFAAMATGPGDHRGGMAGMTGYYRTKFPVFYSLETARLACRGGPSAGRWRTARGRHADLVGARRRRRAAASPSRPRYLAHYDALSPSSRRGRTPTTLTQPARRSRATRSPHGPALPPAGRTMRSSTWQTPPICRTRLARVKSTSRHAKCSATCCSNCTSRNAPSPRIASRSGSAPIASTGFTTPELPPSSPATKPQPTATSPSC